MDLQSYIQLKEAYLKVGAPKEVASDEVVQEEDLVEFAGGAQTKTQRQKDIEAKGGSDTGLTAKIGKSIKDFINPPRSKSADPVVRAGGSYTGRGGAPVLPDKSPKEAPAKKPPVTKTQPAKTQPAKKPEAKPPAAAPASKPPAAAPAAKPKPTPAAQTGNKAADMKSWAKANPSLAAAKAKRDATRGTSASSNPMMKDLTKRMPKPVAPKVSATPAAKPMSRIAKATSNIKPMREDFDIVLDHLVESGFAPEEALKLMVNMSQEKLDQIIDEETGKEYHERMKKKQMPWEKPNTTMSNTTPEMKAKLAAKGKKKEAKKDTRTDDEKMADATGPRKGSRYRGD